MSFPVVPGHEVAGTIEALGEGVEGWETGQRVGVGWFGGNCGWCEPCRRGYFIQCQNMGIPGVTMDSEAAPLLCAGITTYNSLRESDAVGGDLVAILGVGGLGHLGVQFAAKLGFETVAIARGGEKEGLARELGAHHYIDSTATDPAEELQKLGGAKVILSTVTNAGAMQAVIGGLGPRGRLILVGADSAPLEVETLPLERAADAYDRMMSGDARFRMVLTTGA